MRINWQPYAGSLGGWLSFRLRARAPVNPLRRIPEILPVLGIAFVIIMRPYPGVTASERIVHQKGRIFSVETMIVVRGEPVVFLNDDTVPHNIASVTPDNEFDLGTQRPGTSTPVSFDLAGDVAVFCAIHPRMHLTITVKD